MPLRGSHDSEPAANVVSLRSRTRSSHRYVGDSTAEFMVRYSRAGASRLTPLRSGPG